MKIVAGLGNPGEKYKNNRHNVGFIVVDRLAEVVSGGAWRVEKKFESEICDLSSAIPNLLLVKTQTFMNNSGEALAKIIKFYKISSENLFVIHDDLDIKLGEIKIQLGIGPRIHNGLNSIENSLGTANFWRVRVGIDNRSLDLRTPGEAYVLQDFTEEEKKVVQKTIGKILPELEKITFQ